VFYNAVEQQEESLASLAALYLLDVESVAQRRLSSSAAFSPHQHAIISLYQLEVCHGILTFTLNYGQGFCSVWRRVEKYNKHLSLLAVLVLKMLMRFIGSH